MKNRIIALIVSILSLLVAGGAAAEGKSALISGLYLVGSDTASGKKASPYVPGEVLVKYDEQLSEREINSLPEQLGATKIKTIHHLQVHRLKLPPGLSVEEAVAAFQKNPRVKYAEPNYLYQINETTPNDTYFNNLWGLNNSGQIVNGIAGTSGADIKARAAWDISTGSNAIIVAVIDTGLDGNHPDIISNASAIRYDFLRNTAATIDPHGHGTHVAGTIAAVSNNALGVAGVGWLTKIMPLRVASAFGSLASSDIIEAIDYARQNGARVINASYGGGSYSGITYNAIAAARNAGILFVAAAGNNNSDNTIIPQYPASYDLDNIISVASSDQNDNLSWFSNYSATKVHVAAPGSNIYSLKPALRTTVYNFDSGLGGWTTGGSGNTWAIANSQYSSSPSSLAISPVGNYQDNANAWARSPAIDLTNSRGTALSFWIKGVTEESFDELYFEVSTDNVTWNSLGSISGDLSVPRSYGVDLSAYDGSSTFYLRLRFESDANINYSGFFLDEITVFGYDMAPVYSGTEYQFMSGTSMATPHVTGLAALIWGFKPGLSYAQVKDIILRSVDVKSSLAGKTITSGRINAQKALNYCIAPAAPVALSTTVISTGRIDLSWADNTYETGYYLERKTGSGGTFSTIATIVSDLTSYTDTTVTAATTYYYRLQATNYGGNSAYSSEVSATTPAPPSGGGGGGCFIATAAFGSPMESRVQILRNFRDKYLLNYDAGKSFVEFYYRTSPLIAGTIAQNEALRKLTRLLLLPVVGVAYLVVELGLPVALLIIIFALLLLIALMRYLLRFVFQAKRYSSSFKLSSME